MKPDASRPAEENPPRDATLRLPETDTQQAKPDYPGPQGKTVVGMGTARKIPLPQFTGYATESILGEGGMGIVYRARHLRLDRPVAIKTILSGPSISRDSIERMLNEIDAIARLRHPHIIQILDSGQRDGLPYYVMELVDSGNLSTWMARKPADYKEASRLCELLARAIDHAHRNGIVHRDLKPSNVLMTSGGEPKITDFGIAKRSDVERGLTSTGMIIGTPGYLSPEQAEGRTGQITPASDIFSLGVIFYEMLAGRQPFDGVSEMDILNSIIHVDPPSPAWFRPGLPRDLETICLKCLQKKPARRYQSAAELADDLDRFANSRVILARRTGRIERIMKWCRRQPALATLLAALAVAIPAVIAGLLWTNQRQARDLAQKNRLVANSSELSRWVIQEHLPELARLKGSAQVQYELALRLRAFLRDTHLESESDLKVLQELATAHEGVADVLGGHYGQHLGKVSEAVEVYGEAIATWQLLYSKSPIVENRVRLVRCQLKQADAVWYAEGLAAARTRLEELEPLIVELNASDPERWRGLLLRLRQNQYELAIAANDFSAARSALDDLDRLLESPTASVNNGQVLTEDWWITLKRSELAAREGQHEAARDFAAECVAIARRRLETESENPDGLGQLAGALINLADEKSWLGNQLEAMDHCLEAEAIFQRFADEDPTNADAIEDLALAAERISRIQFQLQRFAEAITSIKTSIRYLEKVTALDPANVYIQRKVVLGYSHLGDCCIQTGDLEDAMREHATALQLWQGLERGADTELGDLQILAEVQLSLGTAAIQLWLGADPERSIDESLADPMRKKAEDHLLQSIAAWERLSARAPFTDGQSRNHTNTVNMLQLIREQTAKLEELARQGIF